MMTKEAGDPRAQPWMPEQDILVHQMVGKLGEECSELSTECFRILIQGINGIDPKTGETNRAKLIKEMADVRSKTRVIEDWLLTREEVIGMSKRIDEKSEFHIPWWEFLATQVGKTFKWL